MPGRVCEKHERYVHEGEECPHCEPAAAASSLSEDAMKRVLTRRRARERAEREFERP